ncbi:MAG: type VI secretion system contractile sheath large subunit [Pseudomonadota bacterium]
MSDQSTDNRPDSQHELQEIDEISEIAKLSGLQRGQDGYIETYTAIEQVLQNLSPGETLDRKKADAMIAEIDQKIGAQIDEVLHNEDFQELESAWRGLKYVVDNTDFRQNIKIDVLNVSKEDLAEDFADSPEVPQSGLYHHVYSSEYGTFGGKPYGAIVGNYSLSPSNPDVQLMRGIASVSAMSHAPFIAAADSDFFPNMDGDFSKLTDLKDIAASFESPRYTKWREFRKTEDARYIGLTMPRFLLRLPYDPEQNPVKEYAYSEDVSQDHNNYLWGNASYAFASCLTKSFEKYRWCSNIIGPQGGGRVDNLNVHLFESKGQVEQKIPTETIIPDRTSYELAELGFISLDIRKGEADAAFFSANSAQEPKFFANTEEGRMAEANYKLGTQLPYIFMLTRVAHYLKVLQQEELGKNTSRAKLQSKLDNWIRQYVHAADDAPDNVLAKYPFREAKISVEDIETDPGWYKVGIRLRPGFKYMGAYFDLSLVSKMESTE